MLYKKITLGSAMLLVLFLGFNQLAFSTTMACPVYACEDLFMCEINITLPDCDDYCGYVNGKKKYIYSVERGSCGLISSCYGHYGWGVFEEGGPTPCDGGSNPNPDPNPGGGDIICPDPTIDCPR